MRIKLLSILSILLIWSINLHAQETLPFKGKFINTDLKINMVINLYEESLDVPGLEGLETCYGYINGNINGNWIILKVKKIDTKSATVRVTCDRGNDATDLELTFADDKISLKQQEPCIKTIQDNKYVKISNPIELTQLK